MLKIIKYAIKNRENKYLYSIHCRQGVHFDNEYMPYFSELYEGTKFFKSETDALNILKDYKVYGPFETVAFEFIIKEVDLEKIKKATVKKLSDIEKKALGI